jgi:hypothetical protein
MDGGYEATAKQRMKMKMQRGCKGGIDYGGKPSWLNLVKE